MIRSGHRFASSSRSPRGKRPPSHQVERRRGEGHDPIDQSPTAVPQLTVTAVSTMKPWRFSVSKCAKYPSFASWPTAFLYSRASGSVVDWCVSFRRDSPRKFTVGFFGSSGGGGLLSFGRKLL